ncbi:MAG: DNA polymerase III subunit delta [Planctomycetota bacterium]
MKYDDELKRIRKQAFRSVYLVDTAELFFREEFRTVLATAFLGGGQGNQSTYGGRTPGREIIQEVTATSMFSPRQIVRVTEGMTFLGANLAWFAEYMEQVSGETAPATILLMEDALGSGRGQSDALRAALKVVKDLDKAHGLVLDVPEVNKYKLSDWLVRRAREAHGVTLRSAEAGLIIDNTGMDLMRLDREMEKLATFILPRKEISHADVNALILFDRDNTIYELLDALGVRDADATLRHFRQLLLTDNKAKFFMVSSIYGHLKKLLRVRQGLAAGRPRAEIGGELRVPPYFQDKLFRQAAAFKPEELGGLMDAVTKADRMSKSGADAERVVERLLLIVCAGAHRPALALTDMY